MNELKVCICLLNFECYCFDREREKKKISNARMDRSTLFAHFQIQDNIPIDNVVSFRSKKKIVESRKETKAETGWSNLFALSSYYIVPFMFLISHYSFHYSGRRLSQSFSCTCTTFHFNHSLPRFEGEKENLFINIKYWRTR